MSEPTGPVCPECGTPRATDGTPACSCGRRASDAHRESRTVEAAAAEDFDPVRIRPFVKVGDETEAVEDAERVHEGEDDGVPTAVTESATGAPSLPGAHPPTATDPSPSPDPDRQRRRRRAMLATGAGAAAALLVTGGIVGGLFTYETPSRNGSVSDDVREDLPEAAAGNDSTSVSPSPTAPTRRPSETPSASPSATPSESPATPTGSADPTGPPSSGGSTATAAPAPTGSEEESSPVLRYGDSGPEVTELQLRLRQTGLYNGDVDGEYDRAVENAVRGYQLTRVLLDDESGVYGLTTRAALESETSPDLRNLDPSGAAGA